MPPRALALTKDQIYERCVGTIITARDLRAMTRDEGFIGCIFRNQQMVFMRQFLSNVAFISVIILAKEMFERY